VRRRGRMFSSLMEAIAVHYNSIEQNECQETDPQV
jgi:hypothetical protein